MYEILAKTENLRAILKRKRILKKLMSLAGEFVMWANHFRRNVRKEIDGITFDLDLNESIDHSIYMGGHFERELTNAIDALTMPGYTVMDIGANIGCHTLRFSKLVGQHGKVIAFEPTGYAYKKIRRNIELNCLFSNNITLEKMAASNVSAINQTIRFKSSWLIYGNQKHIHEEVVDVIRIDDYVIQKKIGRVDIMKIDVDGFETQVIEGSVNTIKKQKPVIFLEVNNTQKMEDLIDLLINIGYLFVHEKNYVLIESKEEIINIVHSIPLNDTGYKAANFILLNDKSAYYTIEKRELSVV